MLTTVPHPPPPPPPPRRCFSLSIACLPQVFQGRTTPPGALLPFTQEGPDQYLKLAFQRMDPRGLADIMSQVFLELHEEGVVVHEMAIARLQLWHKRSCLVGADVSHGVAAVMAEALGVEQPEIVVVDDVAERWAQMHTDARALQESELFRKEEETAGGTAGLLVSVWGAEGNVVEACNAAFSALFGTTAQHIDNLTTQKTSNLLLFAG